MDSFSAEYFEEQGIQFIQFQFTTISGELKEVEFPAKNWESMKNGTGVDGSSLGFLSTEQSDMRAIPDLNTFSILPWDPQVGRFICNLYDNDNNPYPTDPRSLLIRVLKKGEELGYFFKVRPELEWYFIDDDLQPADSGSYMCTVPEDDLHLVRREIARDMLSMFSHGSPHTIHHEVGPGQQEIELSKENALYQADNVQTSKIIAKNAAQNHNLNCTFMPKPFPEEAGSGLHIHIYMEDKQGNNLFAKENGISDELRYFIGGIIHHADALSAILNPSTNSYKRLVPNHEAPVYKSWGVGNRTALIRVPGYENKAHLEYRAGDASMNIYLGMAVLFSAGLDGIKNKIQPNEPTSLNVDHMNIEERSKLKISRLPVDLEHAVDAFKKSSFMKDLLGEFLNQILLENYEKILEAHRVSIRNGYEHEWELDQYLEC
ncbi:glutamine synthetase family protein [Candidatus Harpocratesius sp.]